MFLFDKYKVIIIGHLKLHVFCIFDFTNSIKLLLRVVAKCFYFCVSSPPVKRATSPAGKSPMAKFIAMLLVLEYPEYIKFINDCICDTRKT